MDDAFFNWLSECYSREELSDKEIEETAQSKKCAYVLFREFLDCDKDNSGEMAREIIRNFQQLKRQK